MDDKQTNIRMLVGFIAGLILGSGMGYLGILFFNWILPWTGRETMTVTWGNILPTGIVFGLSMGFVMRNPPFGD